VKITLKQLEAFVWVADLGSFRRAAERLNTTQPNISSRIAALESALEITLMERDAGSVRLTSKGSELLEKARLVMRSAEGFIDASQANQLHETALKLGVTEMIAHTWLGQFLKEFKQQYPNVLLELTVDLASNLERELNESALDLSLQSGPFNSPASGELNLGKYSMVWVAAPSSPLATLAKVSRRQIVTQPIITHAKNTLAYRELNQHLGEARLVPSSNLLVALQMVVDAYGSGVLLRPLVEEHLHQGSLVELNYKWRPQDLTFYARYKGEKAGAVVQG